MRAHAKVDAVAVQGSIAIYNLATGNTSNKQRFLAQGAFTVLQAIAADPASPIKTKDKARDALGRLA